jgi:hypothetical protein
MREHARKAETSGLDFEVGWRTDDYETQRGLEQRLYDEYPGARKENGGLNRSRGVDPNNPRKDKYKKAADDFLQGDC